MPITFLKQDDVYRQLNGSICRYDGIPVRVSVSLQGPLHSIYIEDLHDEPYARKNFRPALCTDPLFNQRSVPLGFCNFLENAVYLGRNPERVCIQGVTSRNVVQLPSLRNVPPGLWGSLALRDTILGHYPSYQEALSAVRNYRKMECAFDRHLAVRRKGRRLVICHRGDRVIAEYHEGEERVHLVGGLRDASFMHNLLSKKGVL